MNRQQKRKALKQGRINLFSDEYIKKMMLIDPELRQREVNDFFIRHNANNLEKSAMIRELKRKGVL